VPRRSTLSSRVDAWGAGGGGHVGKQKEGKRDGLLLVRPWCRRRCPRSPSEIPSSTPAAETSGAHVSRRRQGGRGCTDFHIFKTSLPYIMPPRENTIGRRAVSRRVSAPFPVGYRAQVLVDKLSCSASDRSALCDITSQSSGLGGLGGQGDDADVDTLAGEAAGARASDPDVVSGVCGESYGFYSQLDALQSLQGRSNCVFSRLMPCYHPGRSLGAYPIVC
jgi:hypothetical protein